MTDQIRMTDVHPGRKTICTPGSCDAPRADDAAMTGMTFGDVPTRDDVLASVEEANAA